MNRFHSGAVIAFAFLLSGSTSFGQNQASTAPPTNDAIVHHMEELEDQVKELRAEVAALKNNDKFQQSGVSNERSALLRSKHANVRLEHGGVGSR